MKSRILLLLACVAFCGSAIAQLPQIPSLQEIAQAPAWVQAMYAPRPNVWEVDLLYRTYYRQHPFEKNYHTQYYKRWRRSIADRIGADGFVTAQALSAAQTAHAHRATVPQAAAKITGGGWTPLGPLSVQDNAGIAIAEHINTYSLARSESNPAIMFCGTEPGEIYKSTDAGATWANVSLSLVTNGGVTAVAIHPTDPQIVLAGAGGYLHRSTDGGATWTDVIGLGGLNPNELSFNPGNPSIVMACCEAGLFRSTDAGATWSQLYGNRSYDIKWHPTNPMRGYMVKNNSSLIQAEFFTTSDMGATWQLQSNGWYSSTDPGRTDQGARLAVTPADTNRVYAYLIGEAKTGDVGFIGLYRSDDGGLTWTLPNGPAGGPYSNAHPNLARGTTTWQYHQGFYNCALMASTTNADNILIGGLNLWRSDDGGFNFSTVSGYMGGPLGMHVDNQDFRAFGNDYWITTDGGIYHAGSDFFTTQPTVKMQGIHAADYWGFGQGWNEDVVVGGMYHNGNNARHENYPTGVHLALGGGEAPTGYVNPGQSRRTYYSDIGGREIPLSLSGTVQGLPFGLSPNESYGTAESSELEFHPNYYDYAYLGNDHGLWKTTDAGASFSLVYEFGTDPNAQVKYIEISRSNPDVMYLSQQPASGTLGKLWKTTDGGATWTNPTLPSGVNKRKILLALDPENDQKLFAAFPDAGNGVKVYRTTDGGTTWTNLTSSALDGEAIHSIVLVGGTDDGLYACTNHAVFYRDNTLGNWVAFDLDLPAEINVNIGKAFYRDGKIRIASYGKGIWESDLHTPPTRPICTPMVQRPTAICSGDTFYFEDHSMLNHSGATWAWTFQGGSPATSSLRNPAVTFGSGGAHLVTLTVTDGNGQSDTDSLTVTLTGITATDPTTDFEASFPPAPYALDATGNLTWAQANGVGGYGNSATSSKCDNFNVDGGGSSADLRAYVNFTNLPNAARITFDVAYAEYGGQYTDTLEVLASTDCGATFTQLYRKGGQTLATSPNVTANEFVPTSAQWRTDTVDMSAFQGAAEVVVAFRCIGHFGQTMYIDNVNLYGTVGNEAPQPGNFATLAPSPALVGSALRFRTNLDEEFEVRIYDAQGKVVRQVWLHDGGDVPTAGLSAGQYYYRALGQTFLQRGKLTLVSGR